MPRPRKPTQLHVVQGTFNSTRHKGRASEPPVGDPIGDPPDWPEPDKLIWHEIVSAIPTGVVGKSDRLIVELTCRLVIKMRAGEFTPALASQLRCCLAALGMTPADRSRVGAHVMSAEEAKLERFFPT
jgi:hypothetical protein